MCSLHSFIKVLSAVTIIIGTASALPSNVSNVQQRAVDCWDLSLLTFDWFKDNTCKIPEASTCLFYTFGLTNSAREFAGADDTGLTTIWDIWPESYYNNDKDDEDNPLRCIMADKDDRLTYFEHMSEAFAYLCDVFAAVMTETVTKLPQGGIWSRIEFPRLKRADNYGKVNTVWAINEAVTSEKEVWKRPKNQKREESNTNSQDWVPMLKREACGAPEGREKVFDKGGDYEVEW